MSNRKFSYRYKQTLILKHLIGGIMVLLFLAASYILIKNFYKEHFYIALEKIIGYDFAFLIHSYEPLVVVYIFTILELLMWIIIELLSSRKVIKVMDSIDTVLNNSTDTVVLPVEFSELQNWLNYLKMQNREQQRLAEIEAQKKADSLTYLAHDIRTPLASVVGYLSLLCEAPDMPAEQRNKYIHVAFNKAVQFEKLIDDFFDITRYNLSEKALNKKNTNLSFLIEQLSDEFYPFLQKKGLHIDLDMPDDLIVLVDGQKIARVFNNIIKNAIAYSYPQTTIKVSATGFEDNIVVTVTNFGDTIPEEKLKHIFDKFFRANDDQQINDTGTGLGLAIAREIIRMHNGSITARSSDNTITFIISLPNIKE